MNCLNCGTEMTNNQVATKKDHITYDMCEKCGSLWLDAGALDKMAFQVVGSIEFCEEKKEALPERQIQKCPRCDDSKLEKVKFLESDDIFLHLCRNCGGFWLDGGELNLIDQELAKNMPIQGKGFSDFVNNVHIPYWFKRVKTRSSDSDTRIVEVLPIKGSELKKFTSDQCPACGQNLNLYTLSGTEYEGCPKCKGIWLIKDELRKLKNKADAGSLRWMNDEIENLEKTHVIRTQRTCVKCGNVKMASVIFGKSHVLIDCCPHCHGMWLDRGEFDSIIDYLDREKAAMRPAEIEQQAAKDLKRVVTGGTEGRIDELRDASAAILAMANATIFEHPGLFKLFDEFAHLPL